MIGVLSYKTMEVKYAEIEKAAMQLPPGELAKLAESLSAYAGEHIDPEIEKIWIEESQNRLEAMRSGKLRLIDEGDVLEEAERFLNEKG